MIYTAKMARKDAMEKKNQTYRIAHALLTIKQQAENGNSSIDVTGNMDESEIKFLRDIGYSVICQREGSGTNQAMYHISW